MCVENSLTYDDVKSFSIITEDDDRREEPNTVSFNGETTRGVFIFETNQDDAMLVIDVSRLRSLGGDISLG